MKAGDLLIIAFPAILIFAVLLTFINFLSDGTFGLAPMTSRQCIGLKIGSERVEKIFPKGRSRYYNFIRFQYFVPDKPLGKGRNYCLGQTVY